MKAALSKQEQGLGTECSQESNFRRNLLQGAHRLRDIALIVLEERDQLSDSSEEELNNKKVEKKSNSAPTNVRGKSKV